jgi:hypothetical protein
MERKKDKKSIWFLIWEKDFINWLESIDIDTSHISTKRPYDFNRNHIENELWYHDLDLIIRWNSDWDKNLNKSYIKRISIQTWDGGFDFRSKWIVIENDLNKETIIKFKIKDKEEQKITKPHLITREIENFIINLNKEWSVKIIRQHKLDDILK